MTNVSHLQQKIQQANYFTIILHLRISYTHYCSYLSALLSLNSFCNLKGEAEIFTVSMKAILKWNIYFPQSEKNH